MDTELEVRLLRSGDAAEPLLPEWRSLWQRCRLATTFQRPEWILSWMRAFEPSEPLLALVRRQGRLVGLAPLLIYEDQSQRVLGLMGGGVSDYLDVLAEEDAGFEVLAAVLDSTIQPEFSWDLLRLTDLPAASPLLAAGRPLVLKSGRHDVCTELAIPAAAGKASDVIPRHQYDNLKNAEARLQRSGAARIELAGHENLPEFLDALFELHENRWREHGQAGVLAEDKIQAFHRRCAPELLRLGILRFYGLRLDDRLIATLYCFFDREAASCYLQGFDPAYARLSPGTLLLGAAIDDAIRAGKQRVDFLRGQEPYKYRWGVKEASTFCLTAPRELLANSNCLPRLAHLGHAGSGAREG
jgi:CelD/BcsL family acetyltransferase involved in cellulose biosynthesis